MEKKSASFFTISLTQIFLFREQRQQEDNEFDDIYSFFFAIPVRASFCLTFFSLPLILLHANNLLITPMVIRSEVCYHA